MSGGRRLIESRLPFCPGRVIRYIIVATLKKPYCSNLPCIWFEDLQPPRFVPIIISLHFVFHTMEVIREPTYWKCLDVVRIDGWWDVASRALWQHWKISHGGPCLRKPPMPYGSMRKRWQMVKTLENPSGSSLGEDIVSGRKKSHNIYYLIYSKYDWIFYDESRGLAPWRQRIFMGHVEEGQKIPVQNDLCWLPQHLQTCWVRFILWCQTLIN